MSYSLTSSFSLAGVPASVPRARHAVRALLAPAGIETSKIELAVTEAVSNSVQHAYGRRPGLVEVELGVADREVDVVVRDHGLGMHGSTGGVTAGPEGERLGLGLNVMRSVADRFELEADGGTTVRMGFALRHVGRRRPVALSGR